MKVTDYDKICKYAHQDTDYHDNNNIVLLNDAT
jgi:hypothetical protein